MRILSNTLKVLTCAIFITALSSLAQAQSTRTWVSGVGNDGNPCSRTAPCKTYAGAISKTADGGEISVLDPGGYGTLTITNKGLTVDGGTGAGWGSSLSLAVTGFIINDSSNSKTVTLRNLAINGGTTGVSGIRFIAGKILHVENCQIFQFKGQGANSHGIDVNLTAAAVGAQRVIIKDTVIRENSGDGIIVRNSNATGVNLYVENTQISQCNNGIVASTNSKVIARNNTIINNAAVGVSVAAGFGAELDGNVIATNGTIGLNLAAATTRIAGNTLTNQTTAINLAGGTLVTYGDNKLAGNTNEVLGGVIPPAINKK